MAAVTKIESYGLSDIGLVRPNNEDVWVEMPEHQLFVLADGMGGHKAGEVASKEAVMSFCDSIDSFFSSHPYPSVEEGMDAVRSAIAKANQWVRSLSQQYSQLSGMGTTLCVLLIIENTLIRAHVGDSRIYKFQKKLTRLTQDHSIQEAVMIPDQPGKTRLKTMLTRAIGTASTIEPDIATSPLTPGDIYLVCSDGLTDCLSDDEIETVFSEKKDIRLIASELIDGAKEISGHDNITVLLVKAL